MSTYTAGDPALVNTVTGFNETPNYHGHTVTGLPGGGYVIVWQGGNTDGFFDIYMQRYDGAGNKVGTQTQVNTTEGFGKTLPNITFLANGGYVVAWTNYTGVTDDGVPTGGDIHYQVYSAAGAKVGAEGVANTYTTDEQDTPSVVGLPDGGYIISWDSYGQDGDRYGEYAQRYDATGAKVGAEIHISTSTAGTQDSSAMAVIPAVPQLSYAGGLVVVYNSATTFDTDGNATNYDIMMQRYDATGAPDGVETRVNTTTAGNQDFASVSAIAGGFVVTWVDNSGGDEHALVKQQLYLANGTAFGAETTVNDTSHAGDVAGTSVTVLKSGDYVVTWSMSNATGTNYDVYLQEFTGTGTKVGKEIHVTNGPNNEVYSSVAVLSDGSYVVTYRGPDAVDATGAQTSPGIYQKVFYIDQVITDSSAGGHAITGGGGSDVINGLDGDDTLDGGPQNGLDTLNGGDGNDTLIISGGDSANGGAGDDIIKVMHLNGLIMTFDAGAGYDIVDATQTDFGPAWFFTNTQNVEEYRASSHGDTLNAGSVTNIATFTFKGGAGNDVVHLGSGADILTGLGGNDLLDGGTGNDTMMGGAGNDTYVVDATGDVVSEETVAGTDDGGTDTVWSSISYHLGAHIENLTLTGTGNINATGNELANTLTGNDGANILNGGTGGDAMAGGKGDDAYFVDNLLDTVTENANEGTDKVISSVNFTLGANVENLALTDAAITGTGNALDNTIVGNANNNILMGGGGNDLLNGGAGADRMLGGAGDDTYMVDDAGDRVSEQTVAGIDDGGKDTVESYLTFHLGAGFENLTLLGGAAINATGNELANVIVGNTNDNVINGGTGADTMSGGKGNDTYFVDDANDLVIENAGEGTKDKVISSVAYTLTANVENLTVTGTGDFVVKGNDLANIVVANSGNNLVDGGAGGDHMFGGAGNDTYIVDNDGDRISEQLTGSADDGGTDLVMSSVTWHLFAFVENLTLTGTADINATGNNLNNILIGNSGNNVLNGLTGADTMSGGAGNDGYIVDNVNDVVIENANEGTDKVLASVSYTLSANVENLALQGTGNINGTGNALANTIIGNSGNNALDGKGGADVMLGGAGNDTYVVDNTGDRVSEQTVANHDDGGIDLVKSSVSFTLGGFIENLTLIGSGAINGTGNNLANVIIGNTGNNILNGMAGNDHLTGGTGADTFLFSTGSGADIITDFKASENDKIDATAYHSVAHTVTHVGSDTIIDFGGGNTITVQGASMSDVVAHTVF